MNEEWNDSLNGHYLWSNTNFATTRDSHIHGDEIIDLHDIMVPVRMKSERN